jgi:hypothetical protein
MNPEYIKTAGEALIGLVTAFGAIWATYKATRSTAKTSVAQSLDSLVGDFDKERAALIEIIAKLRAENTELRRQLKEIKE